MAISLYIKLEDLTGKETDVDKASKNVDANKKRIDTMHGIANNIETFRGLFEDTFGQEVKLYETIIEGDKTDYLEVNFKEREN